MISRPKSSMRASFLLKGNKVRITCVFRGREMLHLDLGEKVINQFCLDLADIAALEAPPKLLGRSMSTTLAPSGKRPKPPKRAEQGDRAVPKMKTRKAVKARFRVTGTGKLKRTRPGRRHMLTKKSAKRKRSLGKVSARR